MSDMTQVIVPKSDQISADSLIAGDMIIRITAVKVTPGQEQPVSMQFEGSNLVYRPCKSMARVMVAAWGPDSSAYVGRSLQLYRDPSVKWGGMDVGGIRIRKMTHMPDDRPMTMALTATKGSRKPYTVQPLVVQASTSQPDGMTPETALFVAKREAEKGSDHFRTWFNSAAGKDCRATGALTPDVMLEIKAIASGADHLGPKIAADEVGKALADADPFNAKNASDDEIQARIAAELADRDRKLEAGLDPEA